MSLARAAVLLKPRQATLSALPRRWASSHAPEDPHTSGAGHHQVDSTVYPKEDFSSPVWRGLIVLGLATVAFYKLAPSPDEDNYMTRFIAHYYTPREVWTKLNLQHMVLSAQSQQETLLVADAKRPPVHRYRYPQAFDQVSPHLHPVGPSVDLSDLVVKTDKE